MIQNLKIQEITHACIILIVLTRFVHGYYKMDRKTNHSIHRLTAFVPPTVLHIILISVKQSQRTSPYYADVTSMMYIHDLF